MLDKEIKIKTEEGFELSIKDLCYSTGIRTLFGGRYHPRGNRFFAEIEKNNNFPLYRWGTSDIEDCGTKDVGQYAFKNFKSIDLERVEDESSGSSEDRERHFWQQAETLSYSI